MNFMSRLAKGKKGNDATWVIMDRLTKSALFLLIKITDLVDKLARLYVNEVIRLHKGASVNCIRLGSKVHIEIMVESITGFRN